MASHRTAFRVYYEDTDAGGVMYHARYLGFAERGRTEALRAHGIPAAALLERHGIVLVVRRLSADYLRPLRLDQLVEVETAVRAVRAASLLLRQTLSEGTAPAAVLDITMASVRVADMRPMRLPEPWATLLASFAADAA